jgi:hypothetical protein
MTYELTHECSLQNERRKMKNAEAKWQRWILHFALYILHFALSAPITKKPRLSPGLVKSPLTPPVFRRTLPPTASG